MDIQKVDRNFGGGDTPLIQVTNGSDVELEIRAHPELRSDRDICGGYTLKGHNMSVTARNEDGRYLYCTDTDTQICELGPGFSGMIPKHAHKFSNPPIIIDPCPYEDFYPLAQKIEEIVHGKEYESIGRRVTHTRQLCTKVRENIEFYISPQSNIRRYVGTFRDVVLGNPELHGILSQEPYHNFSAQYYDYIDNDNISELFGEDRISFRKLVKMMLK